MFLTTEAKEGGGGLASTPLMAVYRHQWLNMAAGSPGFTGDTYQTARGEMKVVAASSFATEMTFNGVLPSLPDLGSYDTMTLRGYISDIYDPSHNYHVGSPDPNSTGRETYWEGKNLARIAMLVDIADQQGMVVERDSFLTFLKTTLADWFDGAYPHVFYYDDVWTVWQGYPSGFGADSQINDHHFHWGYFIMAAATVARYDVAWAANYEGMVEMLIRDAANWDRSDNRFPYLRHFDVYAGHSWAAGHQAFGAGNNQESSSESMNFATAVILWGTTMGNSVLRDVGVYLYTTEVQAIEQYWFDVDEQVFPAEFGYEAAGIVWGHGTAHAVWWEPSPEEIHGINFLPLTGGSLYLGRRPDYIQRNIAAVSAAPGSKGLWQDIMWAYQAMADPAAAIALFNANPNYVANGSQESGETKAHTYHWLYNWQALGQLETAVTADVPTYAVFNNNGSVTCVAYNGSSNSVMVTFSNGTMLVVPGRTMAATGLGGC